VYTSLEDVGDVGLAAPEGGGYIGEDDGLGVMRVQVSADAVGHFGVLL